MAQAMSILYHISGEMLVSFMIKQKLAKKNLLKKDLIFSWMKNIREIFTFTIQNEIPS